MQIKETARQIYKNAKDKGFHNNEPNIPRMLMLVVTELSEAMEADRINKHTSPLDMAWMDSSTDESHLYEEHFPEKIKNTFEDEIADAIIRLLDLSVATGIDIEWHIKHKMKYNSKRPQMHGKKY